MTTLYLVSRGEYSDYGIVAVCSTRERAETVLAWWGHGEIEEWELDEYVEPARQKLVTFTFDVTRHGEVVNVVKKGWFISQHVRFRSHFTNPDHDLYGTAYGAVFARDEAHAIHAAKDLWAAEREKQE